MGAATRVINNASSIGRLLPGMDSLRSDDLASACFEAVEAEAQSILQAANLPASGFLPQSIPFGGVLRMLPRREFHRIGF